MPCDANSKLLGTWADPAEGWARACGHAQHCMLCRLQNLQDQHLEAVQTTPGGLSDPPAAPVLVMLRDPSGAPAVIPVDIARPGCCAVADCSHPCWHCQTIPVSRGRPQAPLLALPDSGWSAVADQLLTSAAHLISWALMGVQSISSSPERRERLPGWSRYPSSTSPQSCRHTDSVLGLHLQSCQWLPQVPCGASVTPCGTAPHRPVLHIILHKAQPCMHRWVFVDALYTSAPHVGVASHLSPAGTHAGFVKLSLVSHARDQTHKECLFKVSNPAGSTTACSLQLAFGAGGPHCLGQQTHATCQGQLHDWQCFCGCCSQAHCQLRLRSASFYSPKSITGTVPGCQWPLWVVHQLDALQVHCSCEHT